MCEYEDALYEILGLYGITRENFSKQSLRVFITEITSKESGITRRKVDIDGKTVAFLWVTRGFAHVDGEYKWCENVIKKEMVNDFEGLKIGLGL